MARRSAFRRAISFLVMAPVTLILVVFAVSNREEVMLSLWPLSQTLAMPLYLLVLALFALGAFIGVAIGWFSGAKTRRRLREARAEAERARIESQSLRQRAEELEKALGRRGDNPAEASGRSIATMG